MFSPVMLGVHDLEASKKFYDALLGTLGIAPGVANKNRYFYRTRKAASRSPRPSTASLPTCRCNDSTIGFTAGSPEQ